jgi:hypothetical protein
LAYAKKQADNSSATDTQKNSNIRMHHVQLPMESFIARATYLPQMS